MAEAALDAVLAGLDGFPGVLAPETAHGRPGASGEGGRT